MSIVHDIDDAIDDDELRRRLDALARSGTGGLVLEHPRAAGVARMSTSDRRQRTGRRAAAIAAIAAAIGLVGVAAWSRGGDPASTSVAADASTSSSPRTPREQLRAAIVATRDAAPFRVTDDGREATRPVEPGDPVSGAPTSGQSSSVWTYDRDGRVALSWTNAAGETTVRLVHDATARTLYWQSADGGWRRAPVAEDEFQEIAGDPLALWASARCVATVGDRELVILATTGDCPADPVSDPNALHLSLLADGRIDRIERSDEPAPDGSTPVGGWTSVFHYDDVPSVDVPDPATVTDVPTPTGFGWAMSASSGWGLVEPQPTAGG